MNGVPESFFSTTHLEVIGTILVPFILFWLDTRRQNSKMHQETSNQNWEMHRQNQDRLKELETKLEPLWTWYNNQIGQIGGRE